MEPHGRVAVVAAHVREQFVQPQPPLLAGGAGEAADANVGEPFPDHPLQPVGGVKINLRRLSGSDKRMAILIS